VPNPTLLLALPAEGKQELEETFTDPESGALVQVFSRWQRSSQVRGSPHLTFHWRYEQHALDAPVHVVEADTTHILDPVAAYLDDLAAAGLCPHTLYGDYDGSPFIANSIYYIVVAAHAGKC